MFRYSVAEIVIKQFGGVRKMARVLGHRNASTVQGWKATGDIPIEHWPAVEDAAQDEGYLQITARWLGEAHASQAVSRHRRTEPQTNGAGP